MSLVERGQRRVHCDLLTFVCSIDLKLVVVNANFLIGVLGKQGELDGGVEEVTGSGEVELVDIGFFERELGLGGV